MKRLTCWACISVGVIFHGAQAQSTLFSVGPGGPSGLPANIIFEPGSMPVPVAGGATMGLSSAADSLGSFSQRIETDSPFLFCISVTPDTIGGPAPLVDFPFPGISFNVAQQAGNLQQAGDAFITTEAFDRFSGILPTAAPEAFMNNVLVINQSASYVSDFGLLPMEDPEDMATGGGLDDVRGGATLFVPGGTVRDLYFTLELGSPSLPSLSGAAPASGANIFFDATPDLAVGAGGDEGLFASAAMLGLSPDDVIDALAVYDDDEDGVFSEGDQVLFSLSDTSPALGPLMAGPGDILTVTLTAGTPDLSVFAGAELLGLDPMSSNVNMLVPVLLGGLTPIQMIQHKLTPVPEPSAWGMCVALVVAGLATIRNVAGLATIRTFRSCHRRSV